MSTIMYWREKEQEDREQERETDVTKPLEVVIKYLMLLYS